MGEEMKDLSKIVKYSVVDSVWDSVNFLEIFVDGVIFSVGSVWEFVDDSVTKSTRIHMKDSVGVKLQEYKF
jgi:hypothetical protein